jgi:DNA-binding response OmpR family regulator
MAWKPMDVDLDRTLSILVVESDVAAADLMRAVLNKEPGWGATVVHDAAAARAVFEHVRVEMLVVSAALPGISGFELLKLLRADANWNDPPVVLLASGPTRDAAAAAVDSREAAQVVEKPFDVDSLVNAVVAAQRDFHPPGPRLADRADQRRDRGSPPGNRNSSRNSGQRDPAAEGRGLRLLTFPTARRKP